MQDPGRFTIEMAKIGAKISVSDISDVQLKLNKEKVEEAGFENNINWRKKLDVVDLSEIEDESYDATVCYGGALSYIFDKIDFGLNELFRVTKKGGYIFYMSHIGTTNYFMKELFEDEVINFGLDEMDRVTKTRNLTGDIARGHICKMYKWSELKQLVSNLNVSIVDFSASNYLSNNVLDRVKDIRDNPVYWKKFLEWEVKYCADEGTINAGSHILVILQKN